MHGLRDDCLRGAWTAAVISISEEAGFREPLSLAPVRGLAWGRWVPSSLRFVVLGSHARGTGALQVWPTRGKAPDKGAAGVLGIFGADRESKPCLRIGAQLSSTTNPQPDPFGCLRCA